jgi:hypothetical protein
MRPACVLLGNGGSYAPWTPVEERVELSEVENEQLSWFLAGSGELDGAAR